MRQSEMDKSRDRAAEAAQKAARKAARPRAKKYVPFYPASAEEADRLRAIFEAGMQETLALDHRQRRSYGLCDWSRLRSEMP